MGGIATGTNTVLEASADDPQSETLDLRQRALAVLESLREAKRRCDQHLARANRSDAMRQVTGRSSLDLAIASAERAIAALDRAAEESGAATT